MIAKLRPNRVRRSYLGGSRIDAFCGIPQTPFNPSTLQPFNPSTLQPFSPPGAAQPRPEDWLASTTQAFNGSLEIEGEGLGRLEDGRLVRDVVGKLPILVKLLDSDERLVVQAHPTVPCAKRLFNSPVGKTECWYFLPGTAPDACVYLGFKPGITRESWEKAVCDFSHKEHKDHKEISASLRLAYKIPFIPMNAPARSAVGTLCVENNPLLQFLHRIPVSPGDFVFVDGGVPHAIGGGCFMIELQEPSDLMVVAERFTPSGRRIPDAKMHGGIGWERMYEVYEYEGHSFEATCAKYVRRECASARICGPEFTDKFEMWRIASGETIALDGASTVAVVTDGEGSLNGLAVQRGDRLLVSGESALRADGPFSAIVCF